MKINGEMHYLWCAVDHEGEVLESYVTKTRDKAAALTFSRCQPGGCPGERSLLRVHRSDARLWVFIVTSLIRVLRRPVESAVGILEINYFPGTWPVELCRSCRSGASAWPAGNWQKPAGDGHWHQCRKGGQKRVLHPAC